MVKAHSQNARILRALASGAWVTTASIHRRAGTSRLNSRVSELRKQGYVIECEKVPGGNGATGYKYRLLNPPPEAELARLLDPSTRPASTPVAVLDRAAIPRDMEHRYRIYRMVYDKLELLGTAMDDEGVGATILSLGRDSQFDRSCVGLLDTYGRESEKGSWILNPWDTTP